jgi:hypothetical protein
MYKQSMEDPTSFWSSFANDFYWETKWDTTKPICQFNFDLQKGPVFVEVSENFIKFLIEVPRSLSQEYIHNVQLQQSCFVYIVHHTSQTSGLFACMRVSRSLICVHVCVCMWLQTGLVFQAHFLSLFLSESQVWRSKCWTVLGELCSYSGMGWFVHYSGSKEDTQISATMHWTSTFWKEPRRHCCGREMMSALRNASPMMICSNKLVRCVKTSMLQ